MGSRSGRSPEDRPRGGAASDPSAEFDEAPTLLDRVVPPGQRGDDSGLTVLAREDLPTRESRDVVAALAAREAALQRKGRAIPPPAPVDRDATPPYWRLDGDVPVRNGAVVSSPSRSPQPPGFFSPPRSAPVPRDRTLTPHFPPLQDPGASGQPGEVSPRHRRTLLLVLALVAATGLGVWTARMLAVHDRTLTRTRILPMRSAPAIEPLATVDGGPAVGEL